MSRRRSVALLIVALFTVLGLSGCTTPGTDVGDVASADWQVGDRWTYLRSHAGGPELLYEREVVGLFNDGGHEVFELREGVRGHPIHQLSRYTVGQLRFMGFDVFEGNAPRQSLQAQQPLPFHYIFPLDPGRDTFEGHLRQRVANITQDDPVTIRTNIQRPETLRIDERLYDVIPYELHIDFTSTPFPDDDAIVRGKWAAKVGQSVQTEIVQGGETTTYTLVTFDRARATLGEPAYRLAGALSSFELDAGFDARLQAPGYARWLFHVEAPMEIGVGFRLPPHEPSTLADGFDLVALRPLGTTGGWFSRSPDALGETGIVAHMAASPHDGPGFVFHTYDNTTTSTTTTLDPGQVYELLVASDRAGIGAEIRLEGLIRDRTPVERGEAVPIRITHRDVNETTGPGPQMVRDEVTVHTALPADERFEGIVYARNRAQDANAIGEIGGDRSVEIDASGFTMAAATQVFAMYADQATRAPIEVTARYSYRADVAIQGHVDYELGVLLVKLVPRAQ